MMCACSEARHLVVPPPPRERRRWCGTSPRPTPCCSGSLRPRWPRRWSCTAAPRRQYPVPPRPPPCRRRRVGLARFEERGRAAAFVGGVAREGREGAPHQRPQTPPSWPQPTRQPPTPRRRPRASPPPLAHCCPQMPPSGLLPPFQPPQQ